MIPERSGDAVSTNWLDAPLRAKVMASGAEYISVWDAMCNLDGCLTRIGDSASDISASDQVHFTEKGSVFLVQSIIDQLLGGRTARSANE